MVKIASRVTRQSWTVGRDSVEPKFDFMGKKSRLDRSLALPFPALTEAFPARKSPPTEKSRHHQKGLA